MRVFLLLSFARFARRLRTKRSDATLPVIRYSLALMLFLDSHPLPPPTWEGVMCYQSLESRLMAERKSVATQLA